MKGVGRGAEVSMRSDQGPQSITVLAGASGEPIPKELSVSLPYRPRPGRLVAFGTALPPNRFYEAYQAARHDFIPMFVPWFHAGGGA